MTFWTIIVNDLKLTIRDKMFFFWLFIFPLLFAVIFGMAFPESSGEISKVALNVLDNDQSTLSRALLDELKDEKYKIESIRHDEDKKVRTLIIPKGFTQNILFGEKTELILEKMADCNMEASQAAYANVLKAVIKILTKVVLVAPGDETELARQYSLKRLIMLKTELGGQLESLPAGNNHSIPAIAFAFIIFTILMYGGIILLMVGRLFFKIFLGNSLFSVFLLFFFFCGTMAGMSILFGSLIRKEEIIVILNILVANLMTS